MEITIGRKGLAIIWCVAVLDCNEASTAAGINCYKVNMLPLFILDLIFQGQNVIWGHCFTHQSDVQHITGFYWIMF